MILSEKIITAIHSAGNYLNSLPKEIRLEILKEMGNNLANTAKMLTKKHEIEKDV